MASKAVVNFGGTVPKLSPKLLKENQAQTANNVDLSRGTIQPMAANTTVSTLSSSVPKTLWRMGDSWITFGDSIIAAVVDSFIQESNNRFFYTGDSYPKQSDSALWPTTKYRLGVVAPTVAPTITMEGTGDGTIQAVVSYVFTMVTSWGEESAPSPATAVIEVETGEGCALSVMTTPADSGNNYSYKRIYRLAAGTTGAEYCFLAQIAYTETTYLDYDSGSLKAVSTDVLETETWARPPDTLANLTQAHNGMLLGTIGKELYVSEPFIPYAFPTAYKLQFDSDITGIGSTDEFILVVSSKYPHIITGTAPESLVTKQIKQLHKCLSQRGIVANSSGIFFPSAEGLCFCDGSTIIVVTADTYTQSQWIALSPSSFIAKWYGDRYVAFVEGAANAIAIDPATGEVETFSIPSTITKVRDVYHHAADDTLYILGTDAVGTDSYIISLETSASDLTFTWKSKKFTDQDKYNCAKIKGDFTTGTLTFKYYLNGTEKLSKSITAEGMFRLPSDCGSTDKEFQLSGTIPSVDSVQLATSAGELI